MSRDEGKNAFYCNECRLRFNAYAKRDIKKPYCVSCGEQSEVTRYVDRPQKSEPHKRKEWTTGEQERLRGLLSQGGNPSELCGLLDRPIQSIRSKGRRLGFNV